MRVKGGVVRKKLGHPVWEMRVFSLGTLYVHFDENIGVFYV